MKKLSKSTIFSILIIVLSTVCAIFCYLIVPDSSPNANLQIPQLALAKPGSTYQLYAEPILENDSRGFLIKVMSGKENPYKYHPFDSLRSTPGSGHTVLRTKSKSIEQEKWVRNHY